MSDGFQAMLSPELASAAEDVGWMFPSDIQDEAIPRILNGVDVMAAAETGSGKTGAFVLPALERILTFRRETEQEIVKSTAPTEVIAEDVSVRLSLTDKSKEIQLSKDGTICTSNSSMWVGVRSNVGVKGTISVYYEVEVLTDDVIRCGWSSSSSMNEVGRDKNSYGYGGSGKKSNDSKFEDYGKSFSKNDIVGCSLRLTDSTLEMSFSVNGESQGVAYSGDHSLKGLFVAISMKKGQCRLNFGNDPLKYLPTGFTPLAQIPSTNVAHAVAAPPTASVPSGRVSRPFVIMLAPVRDLATQIHEEVLRLSKFMEPAPGVGLVVGGKADRVIREECEKATELVVGTVEALHSCEKRGFISFERCQIFILDEADMFARASDSLRQIEQIFGAIQTAKESFQSRNSHNSTNSALSTRRVQVCFFSATLYSEEVTRLADTLCEKPEWVDLKGSGYVPTSVHHLLVPVDVHKDRTWAYYGLAGSARPAGGVANTHNVNSKEKKKGGTAGDEDVQDSTIKNDPRDPRFRQNIPLILKDRSIKSYPFFHPFGALNIPTDDIHLRDDIDFTKYRDPSVPLPAAVASLAIKVQKNILLLNLIDSLNMSQCIIFCRTNVDCSNLERFLTAASGVEGTSGARKPVEKGKENRYSCCVLAGKRSQAERDANLRSFKEGAVRFLICSDAAARGLDVKGLPFCVNMTMPDDRSNYFHRSGRVGRSGNFGLCISLLSMPESYHFENLAISLEREKLKEKGGKEELTNETQRVNVDLYKEKVWYHVCDKKDTCQNSQIGDMRDKKKGCATMYDEIRLMEAVLKHMKKTDLPRMNVQRAPFKTVENASSGPLLSESKLAVDYLFSLPDEIKNLNVTYGDGGYAPQKMSEALLRIQDDVRRLSSMEAEVQSIYLQLKMKFNKRMRE